MALITSRIPLRVRLGLFTALATSWVSGIGFFALSRWFTVDGDFGPEKHPWQQPLLTVHGGAAFIMMLAFGALLVAHVPLAWRLNRLRVLGLSLVSMLGLQMTTGYLLYYLADDSAREIISNLHAANGFALPFLLAAHIVCGIRGRTVPAPHA